MQTKKTIAGIGVAGTLIFGGVDAAVLNETPLERVEIVGEERVEAKQIGNKVEATFPWKDQAGIKVTYDMGEPTLSERIRDKRSKEVITERVDFGDGGFKVDILLHQKPATNIFCYTIEGADNYNFFYQPPLTEEEIKRGDIRPLGVVGSYAVYHKELKNHVVGEENYATGKVMHIPRPQVWEVDNQASSTVWADLSYSKEGKLCVTVPQDFLDHSHYPVRVDPTFGYTTIGASVTNIGTNNYRGEPRTSPANIAGTTISQISLHAGSVFVGSGNIKGVVVLDSTKVIVTNGVSVSGAVTTTYGWKDLAFSSSPSLSNSTSYQLGWVGDANNTSVSNDAGAVLNWRDTTNSYASPSNPTDGTTVGSNSFLSIYVTYITAGGTPAKKQTEIWY
jgi:hypothetical protein